MTPNKKIAYLGQIANDAVLPLGFGDVYYMYYRADGDLYLYDSLRDAEWNLFHLTKPSIGNLVISIISSKKGTLSINTLKTDKVIGGGGGSTPTGWLRCNVTTTKHTSGILLTVVDEDESNTDGNLHVNVTRELSKGSIKLTVADDYLSSGNLHINATRQLSKGLIKLTVKEE